MEEVNFLRGEELMRMESGEEREEGREMRLARSIRMYSDKIQETNGVGRRRREIRRERGERRGDLGERRKDTEGHQETTELSESSSDMNSTPCSHFTTRGKVKTQERREGKAA